MANIFASPPQAQLWNLMNRKFIYAVLSLAVVFIISVVSAYVSTFGMSRSFEHSAWGSFGDYFGGDPLPRLVRNELRVCV